MDIVQSIFDTIGSVITKFSEVIGNGFEGIIKIFYDSTSGLTLVGQLALITLGVGVVYWAFRLIMRLVKLR